MRIHRATGAWQECRSEALGKGAARTRLIVTAEAAHGERELHRAGTPRQVTRVSAVAIVDPATGGAAGGTAPASHRPMGIEDNRVVVAANEADRDGDKGRWGEHESVPRRSLVSAAVTGTTSSGTCNMRGERHSMTSPLTWLRRALLVLLALVLASLLWLGYQLRGVYQDVSSTYRPVVRLIGEPKATPVRDLLGEKRVTFLVLGSDNDRKIEEKKPLTQSMIIVSVDPANAKVSLISIPRDLWVNIPGHGSDKIMLAAKYGGVALARELVDKDFHVNIGYYAWVGLSGFSSIVNDFGGVTINVTHPLLDDFYPNDQIKGNPYAYTRVFLVPGWRHLSGRQALQYVRSRHGDAVGDFGRSQRQQQILVQIWKNAKTPNLIFKIPQLAADLSHVVRTDIPPGRLLDMARLARRIHSSDITRYVLSAPTYCHYATTSSGESILVPRWKKILALMKQAIPPVAQPSLTPIKEQKSAVLHPTPQANPTPLPSPSPTPLPPNLHALPGQLLYVASGTVYRMDLDGSTSDIMPPWMTALAMPALSPGSNSLVFVRWSTDASNLYIYKLRGHADPKQITNDASPDPHLVNNYMWSAWPAWSPDGKTILFSSDRYKLSYPASESRKLDLAVYSMSRDGSNLRQLTMPAAGAGGDTDPQFLSNGMQYLYDHWAYHRQGRLAVGKSYSQLMIRDITNPTYTIALTPPSGQILQPTTDRSGRTVAYIDSGEGSSKLVVARIVDTRKGPQLRDQRVLASGKIGQPAFSPNGRWISFLRANGGGFTIELTKLKGGGEITLSEAGTSVDPTSRPIWTS